MFCGRCGTPIPEGGLFCPRCGAKADVPAQPDPIPVPQEPSADAAAPVPEEPPVAAAPAEPETVPPAEEAVPPVQEEPVFFAQDEPVIPQDFAAVPEEPQPEKPKRKSKRLLFAVIAAVLVVALLAGGLVYAFVLRDSDGPLETAFHNTGEQFRTLLENCDTLNKVLDNVTEITEAGKCSLLLDASIVDSYVSVDFSVRYDIDQKKNEAGGEVKFSAPGYIPELAVRLYANEDELRLAAPELLKDTYSISLKNFPEKLANSALGKMLGVDDELAVSEFLQSFGGTSQVPDFFSLYGDEAKAIEDSVEVTETDKKIPGAKGDLTVYSVTVDWDAISELIKAVVKDTMNVDDLNLSVTNEDVDRAIDEAIAEIANSGVVLLIGVNKDDCVTAVYLGIGDDAEALLLFEGKENIWNEVTLIIDGDIAAKGYFEPTKDGFRFEIEADGESLVLECDDRAGELVLSIPYGDSYSIRYDAEDNGAAFYADLPIEGQSIPLELHLMPLQKIDRLSGDAVDLLSLSENGLKMILIELYGNLQKLQ